MFKGTKSQSGFSLIELMVVVAIIGILASMGIPAMNKYQAKARQSEAKTTLASIFQAQKAFQGEWSVYGTNLAVLGATVTGTNLRYNAGFAAACTTAAAPANMPANWNNFDDLVVSSGAVATYYWTTKGVAKPAATGVCSNNANPATFRADAAGYPGTSTAATDQWTITQDKSLTNSIELLN